MKPQYVGVRLVKAHMVMYLCLVWDKKKYPDYMFQAADMARDHFREGWHISYAQIIEEEELNGQVTKGYEVQGPRKG